MEAEGSEFEASLAYIVSTARAIQKDLSQKDYEKREEGREMAQWIKIQASKPNDLTSQLSADLQMHLHVHGRMYIHVCVYTHTYTYIHTHTHTHLFAKEN